MMVMTEISLYLLLSNIIVFISAALGSACVPRECLRCNVTGGTPQDSCPSCSQTQCITGTPSSCKKVFQVSINSTRSNVEEGEDMTLTCVHNFTNLVLSFCWTKNMEQVPEGQNKSELVFQKVWSSNSGKYVCFVNSSCGLYESEPHTVTVKNNSVLLLVICGVSAMVLVVAIGLAMKFKLKRDNAKHRERMKQRAQAGQNGGPAALTPRES